MNIGFQTLLVLGGALAATAYLGWDALGGFFRKDCTPVGCSGCPKATCPAQRLQAELARIKSK